MWMYFWALFLSHWSMCLRASSMLFWLLSLQKSKNVLPPSLFFFLKHALGFLSYYVFPHKSQNYCEKLHFILIGIALNLWVTLGSMVILTILIVPVCIFPFVCVIINLVHHYLLFLDFLLFTAVVNEIIFFPFIFEIIFLISLSNSYLLVYKNASDFWVLILCPAFSLNSCPSSNNFLVAFLDFFIHTIMSLTNSDSCTSFFSIWMTFISFFYPVWLMWLGCLILCWIKVVRGILVFLLICLDWKYHLIHVLYM